MSFLVRNRLNFEVPISGFINQPFYAEINATARDERVILEAIQIVDALYPQKFGPYGTHFYSFVKREHFLNLILRFFDRNNRLPDEIELSDLKNICNQKHYSQRDANLVSKTRTRTKTNRIDASKANSPNWAYLIVVVLLVFQSLHKSVARLDSEIAKVNQFSKKETIASSH